MMCRPYTQKPEDGSLPWPQSLKPVFTILIVVQIDSIAKEPLKKNPVNGIKVQ
jgi:hypothetical protein